MEKRKRIYWVDIAKGISILLVVMEHTFTAYSRQVGNESLENSLLAHVITSFFMPAFFLLSGLFIRSSLNRPFPVFLKDKIKRLMIPYFLWGVVSIGFYGVYTKSIPVERVIELPIRPIFVLWFVYSLFICFIAFYGLNRLFRNKYWIGAIGIALYVFGNSIDLLVSSPIDSSFQVLYGFTQGFIFVYIGYLMGPHIFDNILPSKNFIGIITTATILIISNLYAPHIIFLSMLLKFVEAFSGTLLVCLVSVLTSEYKSIQNGVGYLGFTSMQIYLIHKVVVEVFAKVLIHFTRNSFIFISLNMVLTVLTCLLMMVVIQKLGLNGILFGEKRIRIKKLEVQRLVR